MRCVLRDDLKVERFWVDLISTGIAFQMVGAAREKLLSPRVFLLWAGPSWSADESEEERVFRENCFWGMSSFRYSGDVPSLHLKQREAILYFILDLKGSQWRLRRWGVICAVLGIRRTMRAALFMRTWILSDRYSLHHIAENYNSLAEIGWKQRQG